MTVVCKYVPDNVRVVTVLVSFSLSPSPDDVFCTVTVSVRTTPDESPVSVMVRVVMGLDPFQKLGFKMSSKPNSDNVL